MNLTATAACVGVLGTALLQAGRIAAAQRTGRAATARSRPYARRTDAPSARVLVLGDSTGVGVGARRPVDSVAGLLATDHPGVDIVNVARAGERVGGTLQSVRALRRQGCGRFDVALLHVGGNDVLGATPPAELRRQSERLLAELSTVAAHTVWLGAANIGLAPTFMAPLSWLVSARCRRARAVFAAAAAGAGVHFLDFFHEAGSDPFSGDTARYYAPDRVHPSSASYRHCYDALTRATPLRSWLGAASSHRLAA